jgi:site-specific recombinase XerD
MAITDAVIQYRRFLKRRNCSANTVKNYMHTLRQFVLWVNIPIEHVKGKKILRYIDHLRARRLQPKTINCHLDSIRGFYNYLIDEEDLRMDNPVKRNYNLRLPRPLPRYLRDEDVPRLFAHIKSHRDRAIFMLMLRCGLRLEEAANLTLRAIDLRRAQLFVYEGNLPAFTLCG